MNDFTRPSPNDLLRPPTPQVLQHKAPESKPTDITSKPERYIVLLQAPTDVAGKLQIATHVSQRLSCPLFQGDSLHEGCAKAASVSRSDEEGQARYKRMWFNKMVRTGLLFPESSKPIFDASVSSKPRKYSGSSIGSLNSGASTSDEGSDSSSSLASSVTDEHGKYFGTLKSYVNAPLAAPTVAKDVKRSNPALLVLTHPEMQQWHQDAVRSAVQEYGIGILFVPLYEQQMSLAEDVEDDLPILRPLDPSMISRFTSFDDIGATLREHRSAAFGRGRPGSLAEEMVLKINTSGTVEEVIEEVLAAINDVISA